MTTLRENESFYVIHSPTGYVLDVPSNSNAVIAYSVLHRGPNQIWNKVPSSSSPSLFSLVNAQGYGLDIRGNEIFKSRNLHNLAKFRDETLRIEGENCVLNVIGGKLVAVPDEENGSSWIFEPVDKDTEAKPATSCHLNYIPSDDEDVHDFERRTEWTLACSIRVRSSTDCTYFCVAGWYPGGYSGIQQIDSENKVAIFSMWNGDDDDDKAEKVECAESVTVSDFDGEGTGLKCIMPLDWRVNETVRFVIKGRWKDGRWHCSCTIRFRETEIRMATLKRKSRILNHSGFYSFVEDWNRCPGAEGHRICRGATFFDPEVNGIPCKGAEFNKVDHERHGHEKVRVSEWKDGAITMSTGGEK